MLTVYAPAVLEGFEWVAPDRGVDHEALLQLDGTSRSSNWTPLNVRLIKADVDSGNLHESDFPWLGVHALVLRRSAMEVLLGLLAHEAEFLPLACADAELWVLNPLRVDDALDESNSDVVRFGDGKLLKIDRPVFDALLLKT
ncbi:MAG TPA: hypothetical protein VIB78_05580 [Acidimicrobiia bacterium]